MRFFNYRGGTAESRNAPSGKTVVDTEELTDPTRLALLMRETLIRIARLEKKQGPEPFEFEVNFPEDGQIVVRHGFNGPVRWWVTFWKNAFGYLYTVSTNEDETTKDTLVLDSKVAGRGVIRVEPSQFSLLPGLSDEGVSTDGSDPAYIGSGEAVVITSYSPDPLDTAGGETVTITGTNLANTFFVRLDGVDYVPTSVTSTTVVFTSPAKAEDTYDLQCISTDGLSNVLDLDYVEPFTPADLNLTLWLRGDNYSNSTGTWTGKASAGTSGSHNATQGSASLRPADSTVNGHNAPNFDGTDDYVTYTATADLMDNGQTWGFCVYYCDAVNTDNADSTVYNNDAIFSNTGGYTGLHLRQTGPGIKYYRYSGGTSYVVTATTATSSLRFVQWKHVTAAGADQYKLMIRQGKEAWTEYSPGVGSSISNTGTFFIGVNYSSAYYDGKICELAIGGPVGSVSIPSDTVMDQIADYCADFWGVTV